MTTSDMDLLIGSAVIGVLLLGAFVVVSKIKRRRIEANATMMNVRALALWARYGPFESGEQSAIFFLAAWIATGGVRMKFVAEIIQKHVDAFNRDPESFRQLVNEGMKVKIDDQHIVIIESLLANPQGLRDELRSWD